MSFKQPVQDVRQVLLFATSVDEAIPADADVWVLSEVMDSLDWSALGERQAVYVAGGRA